MTVKYSPPDNHYITLDIVFATEHGTNQALLFAKLHRLGNEWKGYTDDDGNKWVRLTLEEWEGELPFLKGRTIRRTIEESEENGLIFSTVFERRSKWYRINPAYIHNVSGQNGHIEEHVANLDTSTGQFGQLPISSPSSNETTTTKVNDLKTQNLQQINDLCRHHFSSPTTDPLFKDDLLAQLSTHGAAKVLDAINLALSPDRANGKPKSWGYVKAILNNQDKPNRNGASKNGQNRKTNRGSQSGYKVSDADTIRAEIKRAKAARV